MEGARSCTGASGGGARERIRLSVPRVSVWCCVRVCVGSCGVREICGVRLFFFFSFLFSFGNYFLFLHKQFSNHVYIC